MMEDKMESPTLAIIGGSGLYHIEGLENPVSMEVKTPFGMPSSPIMLGTLAGKRVAFLARHGIGHFISPSEVNYRANIYALKSIGVHHIVSISACGSLRDDFAPGHIIVPDQLFDFTRGRERTFFGGGIVVHISSADPFCKQLSSQVYQAVHAAGGTSHMGGALVTIEGPRFSTKAESNLFRAWGMAIIGMTACPEAFLAREAELCYATMAHVTDYDVWHVTEEHVSVDMVIRTLNKNTQLAQNALISLVENFTPIDCDCQHALADAIITSRDAISLAARKKLGLFLDKYIKP
jgi:5'-methylthioadenosine phosphorylase